jgi:sporulation protein YlmC with PRC-barrel domain
LSKTEKKTYLPSQKFVGKQVIDVKGSMIGNVKDLAVSVGEVDLALVVITKAGADIQIPWSDIQSIEDVVLLKKIIELPKVPETAAEAPTVTPTTIPISAGPSVNIQCPSCKATIPGHANSVQK